AWGFGPQGGGIQHQVGGISGDGRVIGYLGRGRQGAPLDIQHRLLDTTGADIRQFGREYDIFAPPVGSGGGRVAALKRARATGPGTTVIDVVSVSTGAVVARAPAPSIPNCRFTLSPDGRSLAVFDSSNGTIHLYDLSAVAP